jgi:hypothetical protein
VRGRGVDAVVGTGRQHLDSCAAGPSAGVAAAKEEIGARAKARFAAEHGEYARKLAEREAPAQCSGRKRGGKSPNVPTSVSQGKDPSQPHRRKIAGSSCPTGGGCEQICNAQEGVDTDRPPPGRAARHRPQEDKQDVEPVLPRPSALPEALDQGKALRADTGYDSHDRLEQCEAAAMEAFIRRIRQRHNPPLSERFGDDRPHRTIPFPLRWWRTACASVPARRGTPSPGPR